MVRMRFMGTNNRQRRRAKQAARARSQRQRSQPDLSTRTSGERSPWTAAWDSQSVGRSSVSDSEAVETLIQVAAHADCAGRSDGHELIDLLARGAVGNAAVDLVRLQLDLSITEAAALLLFNGWEPIDLWEITRRRAGAASAALLGALLPRACSRSSENGVPAAWDSQCGQIEVRRSLDPARPGWAEDVVSAIALVGVLDHLPAIESLTSSVGGGRQSVASHASLQENSSPILSKIRALLAKAESTEFAEEADAFTAKASELMLRHRIDAAAIEATTGSAGVSEIIARRCWIESQYLEAKSLLVNVVAQANGCTSIRHELGYLTIVGYTDDVELTELLFTSLLVQATHQMAIAGRPFAGDPMPGLTKRRRNPGFRKSFLVAYATRIKLRLTEAAEATTSAAATELGQDFLPVLARQQRLVDEAVNRLFGRLERDRIAVYDYAGWAAGSAAADLADLNVRSQLRTG
jgi:hypothetical protein